MELFAKTHNITLLKKSMHELGAAFYRLHGDNLAEVVYFSGTRTIHFKGKISPDELKLIKAQAFPVESIEINEATQLLKITQQEAP